VDSLSANLLGERVGERWRSASRAASTSKISCALEP
jgi:hypothetical protein